MISRPLQTLYYHHDFDGVVAAAMVQRSTLTELNLQPVQYAPALNWTARPLAPQSGIVDFLYHPESVLWVDHHETTFSNPAAKQGFRADDYHIFAPEAASCPGVIVSLPWLEEREHWTKYVSWADIIDGARYKSPAQANDLTNPYLLLSYIISEIQEDHTLALTIRAMVKNPVEGVLKLSVLRSIQERVLSEDKQIRAQLSNLLSMMGQVAMLDQADYSIPYRRYLPYECHPQARYGIGLYQNKDATIVSVGENPWGEPGPVHLGHLCREFGGGGRRATAGVPVSSSKAARALAAQLVVRLNQSLQR